MAALLATAAQTLVPADDPGAPAWVVGLVLLALALGVGTWLYRLSTERVSDEVVERRPRRRSKQRRSDPEDVSATLAEAAALAGRPLPDAPAAAAPDPVSTPAAPAAPRAPLPPDAPLADRLAALDRALTSGQIGADEHRVLRAALLDDPS